MREILFRGKRIDNGEWVEGHYGEYMLMSGESISVISLPKKEAICGSICYDVEASTVGQYTGLTDKNGKKIFEGDIVKETIASNYQPIGQIYYAPEFCQWRIEYINSIVLIGHICKGRFYTILGNIHDNPELLEVTK